MKIKDIIVESSNMASAEQIWDYVGGIHPKDQQGVAEEFLGEYPSIETTLGEATHPDLVKYNKKQEKELHRNLDISQGKGKSFVPPSYKNGEENWSDLDHAHDYTGGSVDTNDYLHRQYRNKAKVKELTTHQAKIQALDRILANHKLPQQIVVYTGLRQSPSEAWETYGADVTKPIRLHLPAYTSTTTKLKTAMAHAGEGEIVQVSRARHPPRNRDAPKEEWGSQILMITLPAGLPAASVKKISEFPRENEILLPRGMDIEINPSPTVLKGGDFVWHAQALGHSPVQIAPPMQENFADGRNPQDKGDSKSTSGMLYTNEKIINNLAEIWLKKNLSGTALHFALEHILGSKLHYGPDHMPRRMAEGEDFDRCFDQACKLYDRAVSKNLAPKLVQVADFRGDGNGADPRWLKLPQHVWQHYVVIVGDQVLDPTAKQFGDSMPTQYQVSDLDRLWGKQYQIRPRQGVAEGESNDTAISLSKLGKFHPGADTLAQFVPERATAQYALHPDKWESTFYSLTNKDSDKLKYYGPKKISIPPGTLVGDMAIANKFYRAKTPEEQEQYAELYKASLQPYPVDVSEYRMPELLIPKQGVSENFADGKNPGRKGLAKRSGVNTKASVSSLRKTAKNSSGEKQRMAHWLANMKAGRAKARRK